MYRVAYLFMVTSLMILPFFTIDAARTEKPDSRSAARFRDSFRGDDPRWSERADSWNYYRGYRGYQNYYHYNEHGIPLFYYGAPSFQVDTYQDSYCCPHNYYYYNY